jgi:hypothetical protein
MSDKTVAEKLLIKEWSKVLVINGPAGYEQALGPLPKGAVLTGEKKGPLDIVLCFVVTRDELARDLPALPKLLASKGILWVIYPKGGSGVVTDLNRDIIRLYAPSVGLQIVAQVAVDAVWSALRLKAAP